MRRWLVVCLLSLLPFAAWAEVEVPPLQHRVTDLTGTLTGEQQASLESQIATVEQQKGSQIAVLIVPTTQPEDIAQYSIRVVEAWKLGRKGVDDGVLVLLAKNDRKMRIEVGYGLEGALPDAIAKRIVAEVIAPHFKQGDFYGGLSAGVEKIQAVIAGEPLPAPSAKPRAANVEQYIPALFIFVVVCGALLRAVLGSFMGGLVTGGLVGLIVWVLGIGVLFALVLGFIAFVLTLMGIGRGGYGGFGGGGFGGGGGGFSGGGGGFGGGGASGGW